MVKIAVAGGSGQVAKEIIDALLETEKHEIVVLTREKPATEDIPPKVHYQFVDYNDKSDLVKILRGIHTLLSFVQVLSDPGQKSQKNLIDAAIEAGVKRFAPSEYGSAETVNMPWWEGKQKTREYLKEVNTNKKVFEYTLFQPGLFLDYLAYPYKTAKYVPPLQSVFDFENRRALVVEGHEDAVVTLTTAADLAAVVARAVDYDGEWPEIGGIRGNRVTCSQIIEIGERIRGKPFTVEKVKIEDLEAGNLNASWSLTARHRSVSDEQAADLLKQVSIGMLLSTAKGAWDVSEEFNRLFPDHKFFGIEEFIMEVWEGKQ